MTDKPRLREHESFVEYEDGTAAPHHEGDHPVVIRCPVCDRIATVATTSVVEDPVWICLLTESMKHRIVLEDGEYTTL